MRGAKRPWRRSSGRLRICRLASQVSCAASLSRLRDVAAIVMAKPFVDRAGDLALEPAEMIDIGDHPVAELRRPQAPSQNAARRHIDDLAGIFAPVGQHVAAEQIDLHPLVFAALLGERKDFRCSCAIAMRRNASLSECSVRPQSYGAHVNASLASLVAGRAYRRRSGAALINHETAPQLPAEMRPQTAGACRRARRRCDGRCPRRVP